MVTAQQWTQGVHGHSIFKNASMDKAALRNASLLATYETEVFLAVGAIVRYANLSTMQDYLELDLPDVDFEIKSILINDCRSLLVVVGSHKLVTAFLPRGRSALKKSLSTRVIGRAIHLQTTISQVRMHPYCATSTSLVVLDASGFLRMYDVNLSPEQADVSVDLRPPDLRLNKTARSFGLIEDFSPFDFCFGSGGHGWNIFNVFVLLLNGDVLVVGPLLPSTCQVSESTMAQFGTVSSSIHAQRISHAANLGTKDADSINFSRPAKMLSPVVSEPVLFAPPPLEISTRDIEAQAITFLPLQSVDMLAIAFAGKLDLCFVLDDDLTPGRETMSVAVHETIQLKNFTHCSFIGRLPASETSIYLSHEHGIVQVEMKSWLDSISDIQSTKNQEEAEYLLQEPRHSQVTSILSTKVCLATTAVIDRDFDTFFLACLANGEVNLTQIKDLPELNAEEDTAEAQTWDNLAQPPETIKYQSLLSAPVYRPPRSSQIQEVPGIPAQLAQRPIAIDVESLRYITKAVVQFRADLEELMHGFVSMYRRLTMQRKEYERQQAKINSIETSLAGLDSKTNDRLEYARSRQSDLERRFAKMSQELIKTHSPRLSDAEQKYFQELSRIGNLLHGSRGLFVRKAAADAQLQHIRESLSSMSSRSTDKSDGGAQFDSPIRSTQVDKIKNQIMSNEEILAQVKSRIERLNRLAVPT